MTSLVSLSLDPEQFASLQRLAQATRRDQAWHVRQALSHYLAMPVPPDPLEEGLADAREGHLLDLDDIDAKWRQTSC